MRTSLALLAGLLLAAPPASAAGTDVAADPALSPFLRFPLGPEAPVKVRLHFSHRLHRKKKADCTDCHQDVADSRSAAQSVLPTEASCFECHEESERETCETCHEGNPRGLVRAEQEIVFDHAAHLAREDVECETCHAGFRDLETAEATTLPPMATCTGCHEHQLDMDRLACSRCHTRLPEMSSMPQDEAIHGIGFVAMHGAYASGGSARCAQCHEQSFCGDCHAAATRPLPPSQIHPDRVDRAFVHRGDFLSRHALESSARPGACLACHGSSFCSDCHDRRFRALGGGASASPHPPGYVMRGGAAFHGGDARQNPAACAACHDRGAASNCVECHRVGGIGGNPHPPGWDRRGRREEMNRSGACVPCHAGTR